MAGARWTEKEDEILKNNFQSLSSLELMGLLPGRGKRAIDHRCEYLGLQRGGLNYQRDKARFDEEMSEKVREPFGDYLRRRYIDEQATYRELCTELGINTRTLMRRMSHYGIEPIDPKTAGKRNYQRHKEAYDSAFSLHNSDEARIKSAQTKQRDWARFSSPEAKEILNSLNQQGIHPIPEFAVFRFSVDLAFPDLKLAVEVDGGNWHDSGPHLDKQGKKEKYLRDHGWHILRVTTHRTTLAQNVDKISSVLKSLASTQPR